MTKFTHCMYVICLLYLKSIIMNVTKGRTTNLYHHSVFILLFLSRTLHFHSDSIKLEKGSIQIITPESELFHHENWHTNKQTGTTKSIISLLRDALWSIINSYHGIIWPEKSVISQVQCSLVISAHCATPCLNPEQQIESSFPNAIPSTSLNSPTRQN